MYWCDNRCSDKAIRYWQIASIVVGDGGEAHTINVSNATTVGAAGQAATEIVAVESSRGEKNASRKDLESDGKGAA